EREPPLQSLEAVHHEEAEKVEQQHRDRVLLPSLLVGDPHSAEPIDQLLDRAEDTVQADALVLVHPRHVGAERLRQRDEHDEVEDELKDTVRGHAKYSGFNSAITR